MLWPKGKLSVETGQTHGHVLRYAPRPRLGLLGILDLVEDGVPVPAVELIEELASLLVLFQLSEQVCGHRGGARRVVGGIPPTVGLGTLYTSRRPAAVISPRSMSSVAFLRLTFDHLILGLRGVNLCK